MAVGEYCRRSLVTAGPGVSVREAARIMAREGVGTVIVIDRDEPVGILTDRDIALRVLVEQLDAEAVPIKDLMRKPVVTVREDTTLSAVVRALRAHAVRRLPVVDRRGKLIGVIASDDLVGLIGQEVAGLASAVDSQRPPERSEDEVKQTIDRSE
jgi:CBS domain-containing protein